MRGKQIVVRLTQTFFVLLVMLFFSTDKAYAEVSVGATVTNSGNNTNTTGYSFAHTTDTGTGTLAVVFTSYDSSLTDQAISGVTFNGIALTKKDDYYSASGYGGVSVWYMLNPPIGTYNIAITHGGTTTDSQGHAINLISSTGYIIGPDGSVYEGTSTSGSAGETTYSYLAGFFGGIVYENSNLANLSVSRGTEIGEIDMGNQVESALWSDDRDSGGGPYYWGWQALVAGNSHYCVVSFKERTPIISGTVFTNEAKSTNIGTTKTVRAYVNGTSAGTAETTTGGAYSISTGQSITANDTVVVYIDDETENGSTITLATGNNDISSLDIITDRVILQSETSNAITNADLDDVDGVDAEDEDGLTISTGALTIASGMELYIPSGETFAPGATVTTPKLHIKGTYDAGGSFVTDNNTGLIWQKNGHGSSDGYTIPTSESNCASGGLYLSSSCKYVWQDALKYCSNLSMDGQTDWRLPNVKELQSIVKYSGTSPFIDTTSFLNTSSNLYWSSSTHGGSPSNAWYVDFSSSSGVSNLPKSMSFFVRCVRGNAASGVTQVDTGQTSCYNTTTTTTCPDTNFPDQDGDYTINAPSYTAGTYSTTDNNTGLIWQKNGHGSSDGYKVPTSVSNCASGGTYSASYCTYTWQDALKYCSNLSMDSQTDWRLPNVKELLSIVKYSGTSPPIDTTSFLNTSSNPYWSSSTFVASPSIAWYVLYGYGHVNNNNAKQSNYSNVRCVRGNEGSGVTQVDTGQTSCYNATTTTTCGDTNFPDQDGDYTINAPSYLSYSPSDLLTLTGSGTGACDASQSTTLPLCVDSGATFNPGTGTTTYTGSSTSTIEDTTYYNLTLSPIITGDITYTTQGAETINGNFTVNATADSAYTLTVNLGGAVTVASDKTTTIQGTTSGLANLNTTTGNYALTTGKINIDTGGTLTANGSTVTLNGTSGPLFTRVGTFTPGASTVKFNETTADATLTSGTVSFYNMETDMSGRTGTLGADTTVQNNLTITAGTLDTSTGNHTVTAGNVSIASGATLNGRASTINVSGNWSSSGTYTYGTSTVNLTGGDHVITGNTTFYNLSSDGDAATCGSTFTKSHTTLGNVAPVVKTVTYKTVTSSLTGSEKCWLGQNLGATNQATSPYNSTEAAAGWYWQFNRKQGYKHDGSTRTPNTAWDTISIDILDWETANDPCTLELGTGWRLPTYAEWFISDSNGGWSNDINAYNSVLKLHDAGYLLESTGALDSRGNYGYYWSSTQNNTTLGYNMDFFSGGSNVSASDKHQGFTVRCIRDDNSIDLNNLTIIFTQDSITSIAAGGSLTFTGASGSLLTLTSDTAADWYLQVDPTATVSVSYVDVSYSNAGGYKQIDASDGTSIDSDNNTNWLFDDEGSSVDKVNFIGEVNFEGGVNIN